MARKVAAIREGKCYEITWLDHYHEPATWIQKDEIKSDTKAKMVTMGMCIGNEGKYITMAGTFEVESEEESLYSQVFRCLKANIVSSREIKF